MVFLIEGIKPGVVNSGVTGPTSQIPGLSQSADVSTPAERTSGRRVGIFETDSEYVKLAKSGGHKGKAVMRNLDYIPYVLAVKRLSCHYGSHWILNITSHLILAPTELQSVHLVMGKSDF